MTRQEAINFLIRERKQCLGAQAACVQSEERNRKRAADYKAVITMLINGGGGK